MEILDYLFENHVSVNQKLMDGTTPLISSVILRDIQSAKLLLENGADIAHKDTFGKTAMNYALEDKNEEMIVILKKYN